MNPISHPFGLKKPNELGLYDMSGNVWEFCSDVGIEESRRGVRGGGWINGSSDLRVVNRQELDEKEAIHFVGFRVARNRFRLYHVMAHNE